MGRRVRGDDESGALDGVGSVSSNWEIFRAAIASTEGERFEMGIPAHYSRDIVARCQSLLQQLMPKVKAGLGDEERFDGPLTTTFLLAMATPMIVLPMERIYKPSNNTEGVGDDRSLSDDLTDEVKKVLSGTMKFGEAPFVGKGDQRFVPDQEPFNIARPWSHELLKELGSEDAAMRAKDTSAKKMLVHIRNALAHGGVTYLDKSGGQSYGPAEMLGFVSATTKGPKVIAVHVSRVSENDFAEFVKAWGEWIDESGAAIALSLDHELAA